MKKRQRKKNYKKRYGYNPPTIMKRLRKGMKQIGKASESVLKQSEKALKRISWMAKNLEEQVKNMPEEEFQRVMKELPIRQQVLIKNMRARRKGIT